MIGMNAIIIHTVPSGPTLKVCIDTRGITCYIDGTADVMKAWAAAAPDASVSKSRNDLATAIADNLVRLCSEYWRHTT